MKSFLLALGMAMLINTPESGPRAQPHKPNPLLFPVTTLLSWNIVNPHQPDRPFKRALSVVGLVAINIICKGTRKIKNTDNDNPNPNPIKPLASNVKEPELPSPSR